MPVPRSRTPNAIRSRSRTRSPGSKARSKALRSPSPSTVRVNRRDKEDIDNEFKKILNAVEMQVSTISRQTSEHFQKEDGTNFSGLFSVLLFSVISTVDALVLFTHYFLITSISVLWGYCEPDFYPFISEAYQASRDASLNGFFRALGGNFCIDACTNKI